MSGLIAIHERYKRVAAHWQTHLEKSRRLILQAALISEQHRKAVVLGSGLLLDVPLETLSRQYQEVILIDIAHLTTVRQRCKTLNNVTLLEHDITGLSDSMLSDWKNQPLPPPAATLPETALDADLIVSCNLLSQLAIVPCQYFRKKYALHEDQLNQWSREIILNHLDLLSEQNGKCVLLCDIFHDYLDRDGKLLQRENMLHGISIGEAEQQWQWTIAPLGELDDQFQLRATMQGFSNWTPP